MWLLVLSFIVVAAVPPAWSADGNEADCGHKSVRVESADRADLALACDALADVLAYFHGMGFSFQPKFSVTFAEPGKGRSVEGVVAYGYTDLRSSVVVVHTRSDRAPWGLRWSPVMIGSFLRHELAHIAVWQILGPEATRLRHEWHEFVAYAIQLDRMDERLLRTLLANYPDARAFAELSEVNEFIYGMNPDVFAVMAYLTYREKGGKEFVRRLLRGEFVPPTPSFPFPVLPHEEGSRR